MEKRISKLVIGTVQFGLNYGVANIDGQVPYREVEKILNYAYENGITTLDTADAYGSSLEVIKKYQKKHYQFKIMGKFSFKESSLEIKNILDASLNRLGVDEIQAYYFHNFDHFMEFSKKEDFVALKRLGKLKEIGVSLYELDQLKIAINTEWVDIIQLPFNIFDSDQAKIDLLKKAKKNGKKIYVRSVFLQGLFFMRPEDLRGNVSGLGEQIKRLREISSKYEISISDMALAYCKKQNFIDGILIGVNTLKQLKDNIDSYAYDLPDDVEKEIQSIKIQDPKLLNPACWKRDI